MIKLLPDEKLIFKYHSHPVFLVGWFIAFSLFFALLSLVPQLYPTLFEETTWLIILVLCYFLCVFTAVLDWYYTRLYLKDTRIIATSGFIGRKVVAIPLLRIQDISYQYSTFGRIFEYGDLIFESAGAEGLVLLRHISRPMLIQQKIEIQIQALKTLQQLEKVIQPL